VVELLVDGTATVSPNKSEILSSFRSEICERHTQNNRITIDHHLEIDSFPQCLFRLIINLLTIEYIFSTTFERT